MTPDANDDDRTVIRPPGQTQAAGFQSTGWPATGAGALPPAPDDMGGNLPVGTRLGEFEITALIGEGGFGIVYLAHDHSLQRRVALKEYMPSSLAARAGGSQVQVKSARHRETFEAGLKSFINEARLLASFDHPSLVKVYRFWEANGTAYMVMPLLEGTTLKDVLRQMPEAPDEAWLRSVLGPLTEALLVIHASQCYHRDIAPDNVMLLPVSNRWLLLDFGAARRVIGDMTQALTVILKPGYAPVEQYAEIPGMKQGPWTDVYALAAVVYFAIIGRTPPPSVGRLLNDTYVPLVQAAAGRYSTGFLAAIDRALAVRPEQRTQSIGELRQDLGLGEVAADAYTTKPLPVGTETPPRRSAEPAPAMSAALPPPVSPAPRAAAAPAPMTRAAPAPRPVPRRRRRRPWPPLLQQRRARATACWWVSASAWSCSAPSGSGPTARWRHRLGPPRRGRRPRRPSRPPPPRAIARTGHGHARARVTRHLRREPGIRPPDAGAVSGLRRSPANQPHELSHRQGRAELRGHHRA